MPCNDKRNIINKIRSALAAGHPIYLSLPGNGLLVIDRPVPFLLVYRLPPDGVDDFTYRLGKTESAYIIGHNAPQYFLHDIVQAIAIHQADTFGGFLLLEVWISRDERLEDDFIIHVHHKASSSVAEMLKDELEKIVAGLNRFSAAVRKSPEVAPPYYTGILPKEQLKKSEILLLGLEIKPAYINKLTGKPYPLFLRELRRGFGKALKKVFFEFVRLHTSFNAAHFEMLGKTVMEDLVWNIDARLAEYCRQFDFLLLVTPVNAREAWEAFKKNKFRKTPVFHYRQMPIDPELIKRKLYDLPVEEIADPTIAFLFRDKRKEIDRMLNMMAEREKPDFMLTSMQLFGSIDESLLDIAHALLVAIPPDTRPRHAEMLNAQEFAALASAELQYLKEQYPEVTDKVQIRDDIEGILVSEGVLYINKEFTVDKVRAGALIQHEIGTHVATYFNGKAQPLHLLSSGVPGYEQLQEGLAVMAEYLMKGLTGTRLRTLAARVVAVHQMTGGHSFTDTFLLLTEKFGFADDHAFSITMRAFRGGGLTKDAVYLKGLLNLLEYIKAGHDIEPLLIGKIRQDYLPVIDELIHRRLLNPIPMRPRYLRELDHERYKALQNGISIFNMPQL